MFFEFLDRNLSELQKNLGAHFPISSDASPTSFRPGGVSFWGSFLFSFVRIYSHLLRTGVERERERERERESARASSPTPV